MRKDMHRRGSPAVPAVAVASAAVGVREMTERDLSQSVLNVMMVATGLGLEMGMEEGRWMEVRTGLGLRLGLGPALELKGEVAVQLVAAVRWTGTGTEGGSVRWQADASLMKGNGVGCGQ